MDKFTPGPWRYIAHGGYSFYIHSVSKPTAPRVATVSYTDGAHSFHEADARMIAAAPEMYEALCKIAEGPITVAGSPDIVGAVDDLMELLRDIARPVIAKVRGEAG